MVDEPLGQPGLGQVQLPGVDEPLERLPSRHSDHPWVAVGPKDQVPEGARDPVVVFRAGPVMGEVVSADHPAVGGRGPADVQ